MVDKGVVELVQGMMDMIAVVDSLDKEAVVRMMDMELEVVV